MATQTNSLLGEQPRYGSVRNRDVYDKRDWSIPARARCSWKYIFILIAVIVIAGICVGIFMPRHRRGLEESIFGGMYSIAINSEYDVPNHYTQDMSCPDGYTAHIVAHFLACYNCGTTQLHLCLKDDTLKDPRKYFGGMFNVNHCSDGKQFVNPLTGDYGCNIDAGYKPYLAVASNVDGECDTDVFVCLKGELELDYYNFGGVFTEFTTPVQFDNEHECGGCDDHNVINSMSDELKCPDKYDAHLIAHAYSPLRGNTECPGCNGKVYVCLIPNGVIEKDIDEEDYQQEANRLGLGFGSMEEEG